MDAVGAEARPVGRSRSGERVPLNRKETRLSEQRKHRSWTAKQKLEIVLAGLKSDRSVRVWDAKNGVTPVCRCI